MSNELPIVKESPPRKVSRRELAQTLLSGLAAGLLLPGLSPLHPVYDHLRSGKVLDSADEVLASGKRKPIFLSSSQSPSLERIAEAIVPGSRKAQSAAFIDLLLSVDSAQSQQAFVASLAAFDAAADRTFHKKITALSEAQLNELLQAASIKDSGNYVHFQNLKGWAVGAYYSSEIGMRELGWIPDRIFPTFPACTHAESHS
jgi:Gluconate 2-dehydrogenase subunit 3